MKYWAIVSSVLIAAVLTGCATPIQPSYVSPTQYQTLNCTQLQSEYHRIQQYIEHGVAPAKRTGMGIGLGLGGGIWSRWLGLWPDNFIQSGSIFQYEAFGNSAIVG